MKRIYIALTLCCALIGCKKNDVSFTYSPTQPRAGQSVSFANHSTSGEEWEWTFGDGATTTIKSPSHIYKNPGTYLVTLKVDKKKSWMASTEITIYDTIPTFVCEDTVFTIYQDYTFTANVYNPYNYDVSYEWIFPLRTPYVGYADPNETLDKSSVTIYFTQALSEAPIWLQIVLNGDTTLVQQSFKVEERATNSVLIRTKHGDYRQRIFGSRAEWAMEDPSAASLLDAEQDTMQVYNGHEFRLSELKALFPELEGFHISNRKVYFRAGGLWVANLDGANIVQIDAADCPAMTLDTRDARIYWANDKGVWYMPFIGSDNNKFVTTPTQLNTLTGVTKLAADNTDK